MSDTIPQGWSTRAGSRKQHFYKGAAAACGDAHPPDGALGAAPLAYPPRAELSGPPWGVCHRCRRAVESVEELAPHGGLQWTRGGGGGVSARTDDENFVMLGAKPYRKERGGAIVSWHWTVYASAGRPIGRAGLRATLNLEGTTKGPSAADAKLAAVDALDVVRGAMRPIIDHCDEVNGADDESGGEE